MKKKRTQFDLMKPIYDAFQKISSKELSSTQRMLLLGLYRFMDGNGYCYPSYKAISEITGLSKNAISVNLKKLVEAGWLTYKQGGVDSSNHYQLNLTKLGLIEDKKQETSESLEAECKQINGRFMTKSEAIAAGYNWDEY
ncbi:helix-turn-helix domain-containing protein [Providencia rettgeri]